MKRLITILLCSFPALANEPPYKPLAVCEKGKCWMTEADYLKFQAFHKATFEVAIAQQELIEMQEKALLDAQRKMARSLSCHLKS